MKKFKVDLSKLEGQRYEKLQYLLSEGLVDFQYIYKTGPTAGTIRKATGSSNPYFIDESAFPSGEGESRDQELYTTYFDSGRNEWRCCVNQNITFIGNTITLPDDNNPNEDIFKPI